MTSNGMNTDENDYDAPEMDADDLEEAELEAGQQDTSAEDAPTTDLWGDLPGVIDIRSPKRILSEQARALGMRTQQVLRAKVTTTGIKKLGDNDFAFAMGLKPGSAGSTGNLQHELSIIAPFLNNYEVTIVRVVHSLLQMYPLTLYDLAGDGKAQECANEAEFEHALELLLQSEQVRRIIRLLLAQSRDYVA